VAGPFRWVWLLVALAFWALSAVGAGPAGGLICAVAAVGSGLERAGGESLGSACGPMMTTPYRLPY